MHRVQTFALSLPLGRGKQQHGQVVRRVLADLVVLDAGRAERPHWVGCLEMDVLAVSCMEGGEQIKG